MTQSSRHNFLKTSTIGVAAVASNSILAKTSGPSSKAIAEVEAFEAKKIEESTASWDDGLAHPIPYQNPPGIGKDRAIVLGGGPE